MTWAGVCPGAAPVSVRVGGQPARGGLDRLARRVGGARGGAAHEGSGHPRTPGPVGDGLRLPRRPAPARGTPDGGARGPDRAAGPGGLPAGPRRPQARDGRLGRERLPGRRLQPGQDPAHARRHGARQRAAARCPGQRVEWILARSRGRGRRHRRRATTSTASTPIAPLSAATYAASNDGNKIDNQYAVSVTNFEDETIDAANNYPYIDDAGARMPDFHVKKGQSWITVTSVYEGVTDIIAYVPGIKDGSKHKIFAKKIWADYAVRFPDDAIEPPARTRRTRSRSTSARPPTARASRASRSRPRSSTAPTAAFDAPLGGHGPRRQRDVHPREHRRARRHQPRSTSRRRATSTTRSARARRSSARPGSKVALECRCATSLAEVNVNDPVDVDVHGHQHGRRARRAT